MVGDLSEGEGLIAIISTNSRVILRPILHSMTNLHQPVVTEMTSTDSVANLIYALSVVVPDIDPITAPMRGLTHHNPRFTSNSFVSSNSKLSKIPKSTKKIFNQNKPPAANTTTTTVATIIDPDDIPEIDIIDPHTPVVGTRLERPCLVNDVEQRVLFDTGSPTSLISQDIVTKYNWHTFSVPLFTWKGAIKGKISTTTTAVSCKLEEGNRHYRFGAYVSADLEITIIVGNPLISHHPELLHTVPHVITAAKPAVSTVTQPFESPITTIDDLTMGDVEEVFMIEFHNIDNDTDTTSHELPQELQEEFKKTVSNELPPSNPNLTYNHEIILKPGSKPPRLPPYRMTPLLEKECKKIIDEFLKKDFIVESKSPVSSPVLLVKKKDGTYRLVIDYRQLNSLTVKDPFPLPRIDDLMAKIGDCSVFSSLDLHSGYHQIPMDPASAELTGFSTPFGHYHYKL